MSKKPVGPDAYNRAWIESAWGSQQHADVLSGAALQPRPRVKRAIELATIGAGQRVLDIACGRGEVVAIASEMGAYAIGLDFSPTVLGIAAELKSDRASRNTTDGRMELVRADACVLPFADNSFDRITMLDIIEHLLPPQLDAMLQEVHRTLKPEGFAVIHTLPNRWVYDLTYPLMRRLMRTLPDNPRSDIEKEVHVNEQDLPSLHRTLKKNALGHRLWLEQHMPAQARWTVATNQFGDNRDALYPALAGTLGRALDYLSMTPLKLFLCNDIFGLLWKGARPNAARLKFSPLAQIACLFPARQPKGDWRPSEHEYNKP